MVSNQNNAIEISKNHSTYTLCKSHNQKSGVEKGPLLIASRWVVAEDCAKMQKMKLRRN